MVELRADRVAELVEGILVQGSPCATFSGFNFDSRLIRPGELFFAIIARRNGHDFVPAAADQGAKGAVVSEEVRVPGRDFALIKVRDTEAALQILARKVLAEHPVKVIDITGSIGKTTTKEFTAALLAANFSILKSEANFNNRLGLALTLLRIEKHHQAAVLELGMNAPGEIRALTAIAPPDIAVVTNINPVHLEFLGTLDNIAAAKREILEGMKPGGTAVLNGDDSRVRQIAQSWQGRRITFGLSDGCDVQARNIKNLGYEGMVFNLKYGSEKGPVRFPFLAETYIMNLLAALGVTLALSLPLEKVERPIQALKPFSRRGILLRLSRDVVVIDDTYNSNPKALETALASFSRLPAKRKIAVLGDMLELGKSAAAFHEEAGRQVVRTGWNFLVTVGPLSRSMATGARAEGMPSSQILSVQDSVEGSRSVLDLIRDGDLILVKGSRGMKTEIIVDAIQEAFEES